MSRAPDDLQTLCRLARQHEDPAEEELRLVRARLAAHLAGGSAVVLATSLGAKSAAAAGTGQVLAGATASGATKAAAVSGVAVWLGGGVTVTVGVALVVQAISASQPPAELPPVAPSVAPAAMAPATATPGAREMVPAREGVPARETASVASGVVERQAKPGATAPARETASPPTREKGNVPLSLEQEARALAEVQRALRDGRASEALALLAEQDQRYESGALGVERAAAHALALCASGRFAEARPIAERFSRGNARSPLAERVRRRCLASRGSK